MTEFKPYVGVSGVVNPEQQAVLREAAASLKAAGRSLAIGIELARATQWHDSDAEHGSAWRPLNEVISGCVVPGECDELRIAQISLDQKRAGECGEEDYGRHFVDEHFGRVGVALDGVQLGAPWDDAWQGGTLGHVRRSKPDYVIILEADKRQMDQHGPKELVDRLSTYACNKLVDCVSFDVSHEPDTALDIEALRRFVDEVYSRTNLKVGITGGLDDVIVARDLPAILQEYPDLCFGVGRQLHKEPDSKDYSLDLRAACKYLRTAAKVIAQTRTKI